MEEETHLVRGISAGLNSWLHFQLPLKLVAAFDDSRPSETFWCWRCFVATTRKCSGSSYSRHQTADSRYSPTCDHYDSHCWCCYTNPSNISFGNDMSVEEEEINQWVIDNFVRAKPHKSFCPRSHCDRMPPHSDPTRRNICLGDPNQRHWHRRGKSRRKSICKYRELKL